MIIDLTHTISPETFVYPGTPRPAFSPTRTLAQNGARETPVSYTHLAPASSFCRLSAYLRNTS